MLKKLNRLRLFVRDYIQEFGTVWAIARSNDCDRNGGHRWQPGVNGFWCSINAQVPHTCARCGSTKMVQVSSTTGSGIYIAATAGWQN